MGKEGRDVRVDIAVLCVFSFVWWELGIWLFLFSQSPAEFEQNHMKKTNSSENISYMNHNLKIGSFLCKFLIGIGIHQRRGWPWEGW